MMNMHNPLISGMIPGCWILARSLRKAGVKTATFLFMPERNPNIVRLQPQPHTQHHMQASGIFIHQGVLFDSG